MYLWTYGILQNGCDGHHLHETLWVSCQKSPMRNVWIFWNSIYFSCINSSRLKVYFLMVINLFKRHCLPCYRCFEKKFLIIFTTYKVCKLNCNSEKLQFHYISTWPCSYDPRENGSSTFPLFHLCHLYLVHLRLGLYKIEGLWGNNRGKCEDGAKQ